MTPPADPAPSHRRTWALRGLAGGAAFGAGLLTFLMFAAGNKVALETGEEILIGYSLMTLLGAALGAAMGYLHGGSLEARESASRGEEPTRLQLALEEAGKGFRIGLVVAVLYVIAALVIFLEERRFLLWVLALRAALALVLFPVGVGLAGLLVGMAKPK